MIGEERRAGGPARARRRAARAVAGAVHPPPRRRPGALGVGHRPLPDLSAEVQVRPGLRDPAGADHQPAVRDPHPPGAGAVSLRGAARRRAQQAAGSGARRSADPAGSLDRLLGAVRGGVAANRVRLLGRRAPVPRPRGGGAGPLPRATSALGVEAGVARAELRLRDRPAPAPRPRRSGRPASGRRLRADRLQDRGAADGLGRRRAAGALPARRPGGLAGRGRARQLLVRARRRAGAECRRRPTTPSGWSARCSRSAAGNRGPGLRAAPVL